MGLGLLGLTRCEDFGDGGRHYLRQQTLWVALGMMAMLAATLPSYRRLCHWSYAIFGLAISAAGGSSISFDPSTGHIAGCVGDMSVCNRPSSPSWLSFLSWADT